MRSRCVKTAQCSSSFRGSSWCLSPCVRRPAPFFSPFLLLYFPSTNFNRPFRLFSRGMLSFRIHKWQCWGEGKAKQSYSTYCRELNVSWQWFFFPCCIFFSLFSRGDKNNEIKSSGRKVSTCTFGLSMTEIEIGIDLRSQTGFSSRVPFTMEPVSSC